MSESFRVRFHEEGMKALSAAAFFDDYRRGTIAENQRRFGFAPVDATACQVGCDDGNALVESA